MTAIQVYDAGDLTLYVEEDLPGMLAFTFQVEGRPNQIIDVDAADFARDLISASPTFARGLGEMVQRAILSTLVDEPSGDGD